MNTFDLDEQIRKSEGPIGRFVRRVEEIFFAVLLLAIVVLGLLPILMRGHGTINLSWAEPLTRQMVLWLTLVGAAAAVHDRKHISIDVIGFFLSERWKRRVRVGNDLITLGLTSALAWISVKFVQGEREIQSHSVVFEAVPEWIFAAVIPAGLALIAVRLAITTIADIRALRQRPGENPTP